MRAIALNKINPVSLCVTSLLITFSMSALAQPVHTSDVTLTVLWSTPVMTALPPPVGKTACFGESTGITLTDQVFLRNNQTLFLGEELVPCKATQVFFTDLEHRGFKNSSVLNLQGVEDPDIDNGIWARFFGLNKHDKKPSILSLGVTSDDAVWAGGYSNTYMDIASGSHSNIYLAKYGTVGKPVWEKLYGSGFIGKIAPTASGDIVVIGFKQGRSWLARIAPDGRIVWETQMDKYNPVSVVETADNKLIVVGYIMKSNAINSPSISENVLILDGSGKQLNQAIISTQSYSLASDTSVIPAKDVMYVVSSWADFRRVNPVEITKLKSDGTLFWQKSLADTISLGRVPHEWASCRPTMTISSNAHPIVACALNDSIQLYDIDGTTGSYRESYVQLPECQKNKFIKLYLKAKDDNSMIVSGTGGSCTWIGRLQKSKQ